MSQDDDDGGLLKDTIERFFVFLTRLEVPLDEGTAEGATNRIVVIGMAGARGILDATLIEGGLQAYQKALARERSRQLSRLWLNDRLDSPWRLLVEQEFPGKPVEFRHLLHYAREAPDRILQAFQTRDDLRKIQAELFSTLVENGYSPSEGDLLKIVVISSYVGIARALPGMNEDQRASCEELIRDTDDPDHPAWQKVLELYFGT